MKTLTNRIVAYRLLLITLLSMFVIQGLDGQKKAKKFFVTGIVTDSRGTPAEDAVIFIDNKSTDKLSDKNGFFRIKVKPEAKVISALHTLAGLGEAEIDGENMLRIELGGVIGPPRPETRKSSDEQINIGYGTVDKQKLITPVTSVNNVSSKYASYNNIYDVLKGTVPGVQVKDKKIVIGGPSSFNLSSEPLFIVDGMEVSTIDDIQPVMIESIQVLKGPSASIYGVKGANGVILIRLTGTGTRK